MAAAGDIEAIKRGNAWWLDRRDVERRGRLQPGRGPTVSAGDGVVGAAPRLGARKTPTAVGAKHHPARARGGSTPTRWLTARALRARARRESFDAHPVRARSPSKSRRDVMRTGISATDVVGVQAAGDRNRGYAPARVATRIVESTRWNPARPSVVRWVPDELWPAVHRDVAPSAAVLVDLLEHDDPRARREAERCSAWAMAEVELRLTDDDSRRLWSSVARLAALLPADGCWSAG